MNLTLKQLKDIHSECCVTILLNTHRTRPDNQRDPILLKNLVKDAESRLFDDYDKRFAKSILDRINQLVDGIDHNHNLESLVLFVNEEIAEYARLPISLENRVVIDETFATRELVRALNQQEAYYVLALSRDEARLIEAFNDKVVLELGKPFPIQNKTLYSTDRMQMTMAQGQDNLIEEFFNRVDKDVNKIRHDNPLPVLVCTEERNYHHYLKVADHKNTIIGHLNKNRNSEKDHAIVREAWPIVKQVNKERNEARLSELKIAVGSGKFLSDYGDIWKAILEGRGQTLFVQEGLFQPARMISDLEIALVSAEERDKKGIIDDIVDEMIENTMRLGGDIVFLPGDELNKFQGLALITRY
ncbi:MAG TPA: hypothetical protein PKC30_00405 [Saprospiraceae bacterium]|nr:hypothetical protein [Saprospiraceae bacterium]